MKGKNKNKKARIIAILFGLVVLGLTIYLAYSNIEKEQMLPVSTEEDMKNVTNETESVSGDSKPIVAVEQMPEEIKGYAVIGKIVIEKIGVEKYILSKTTDESLKESLTRFYGSGVNKIGNLCICGHNSKDMLKELKQLVIGDTFYLVSRDGEKVTYQVDQIDKAVNPKDLSCLDQETNQQKRVTIITCNPRRSNKINL